MVSPVTDPTRPSFSNPVQNQGCGHLAEDLEGSWGREQGTGPACSSRLLISPSSGTLDMGSAVEPWSFCLWGVPAGGSRDTVGPPALLLEMLQPPEVHQSPLGEGGSYLCHRETGLRESVSRREPVVCRPASATVTSHFCAQRS